MQAENFRAEIRRIAHAAARAQIIQIAGDEAHADFADEAVHKRRRLFKRRFRMFAQMARRGQHDRRPAATLLVSMATNRSRPSPAISALCMEQVVLAEYAR